MGITGTGNGGVLVAPPSCVPAKHGLMSVAEVEDRADGHWQGGVEYELETCEDLFVMTPKCNQTIPDLEKEVDGGTVDSGNFADPFTMIAAYKCGTVGRPLSEAWEHAEIRLDRGEGRTLERTFWTGVDKAGNAIRQSLGQNSEVVDLSGAGAAVSITDGVAILESWAGENYPCSPILHAQRGLGVYMGQSGLVASDRNEELRVTGTGSRVVIGGGYEASGPNGVSRPTGVTATPQGAGGTLASDTYEYVVTATSATGESLPSSQVSATVVATGPGATGSVDLSWTPVTGATGYKIYGRQAGALGLIGTNAVGDTTFTDTGAVVPAAAPPTEDTSNSAPVGESWIYVTGSIKVLRGPTFFTPNRGDDGGAVDRLVNDVTVFAERTYAIQQDCIIGAVRVLLQSCC